MKILNWNISWAKDIMPKIEYLRNQILGESFIVILQEVKPHAYNAIEKYLSDAFVKDYDSSKFVDGERLTTSRIIKREIKNEREDLTLSNHRDEQIYDGLCFGYKRKQCDSY